MASNKRVRSTKVSATISTTKKKAMQNLKFKKGTTYAALIRHALEVTYGI